MDRKATAIWERGLRSGEGKLSTESGAIHNQPYSFRSRFQHEKGTNPEELIAAAHAGCFSMALAKALEESKYPSDRVTTQATVHMELKPEGFQITRVHLDLDAKVPGIETAYFEQIAHQAKETCPVSRLLAAPISLSARLDNSAPADRISA